MWTMDIQIDKLENNFSYRFLRFLPWLILLVSLGITFCLQRFSNQQNHLNVEERFHFRANEMAENIQNRLHNYKQVLQGTKGLFISSKEVEREEFRKFVNQLNLHSSYPGIQGLGFTILIKPEHLQQHIESIRAGGFSNYTIKPEGRRSTYSSIIYLEPFDWRNKRAFGYDMFSEPVRHEAMQLAADENKITISRRVILLQETEEDRQPGFLMYLPIYQHGMPDNTLAERRKNIIGWVYAPFRMYDLMKGIMGAHFEEYGQAIGFDIYDGPVMDQKNLLYDYQLHTHKFLMAHQPIFTTTRKINLGNHDWTIKIYSLPALESKLDYKNARYISIAGVIISLLLSLTAWLLINGRTRAYEKAREMTQVLRASENHATRLNRDLKLLSDCNMTMLRVDEEQSLLQTICEKIVNDGGYLMAWVGYAEHNEEKTVRPVAQAGFNDQYLQSVRITWAENRFGFGPTGTCIRTGKTDINHNYLNNPRMAPWKEKAEQYGYQSSIAIPLISKQGVIGALTIYSAEADIFDPEEVKLLEELAADLSFGIESLRTKAAHRENEEKIAFMAYHDSLTKLPNRQLLNQLFSNFAEDARQHQLEFAAVSLDLDNFKHINDTLGHSMGDKLLIEVTEKLKSHTGEDDLISRHDGDKFIIIVRKYNDDDALEQRIKFILEAFSEPFNIEGNMINTTCSIGVSIFPKHGASIEALLKKSDIAMYSAKDRGRNTYQFYTDKMNADAEERLKLMGQLHQAIKDQQFLVNYQPQIDIKNNRIIGLEALTRWQHPDKGLIPPATFIHLAETNGLIVPLGEWVLQQACMAAKGWMEQGHQIGVSVNLSAIQFRRGNLLQSVANALELADLPPHLLELELTESILLQDMDSVMETLHQLKEIGVKLAIDDFGTGYSSLSYLKQLSVDRLKIDQSFVRDLAIDTNDEAIVNAIIKLSHAMNLRVIAEGVENSVQLARLKKFGCDEYQGYFFSKPKTLDEINELLKKQDPTHPII